MYSFKMLRFLRFSSLSFTFLFGIRHQNLKFQRPIASKYRDRSALTRLGNRRCPNTTHPFKNPARFTCRNRLVTCGPKGTGGREQVPLEGASLCCFISSYVAGSLSRDRGLVFRMGYNDGHGRAAPWVVVRSERKLNRCGLMGNWRGERRSLRWWASWLGPSLMTFWLMGVWDGFLKGWSLC